MLSFTSPTQRLTLRTLGLLAAGTLAALVVGTGGAAEPAVAANSSHPIGSWEKYPWSSTLYRVGTEFSATAQTYAQWEAAGFPGYETELVLGSSVWNYVTNSDEIIVGPMTSDNHPQFDLPHHVTPSEWVAIGSPMPTSQHRVGFIKTASSDNVYECAGYESTYHPRLLSYDSWARSGTPTPVVVASITARCP
ncbi:hypothetical protein D6T64_18940 [Cryobacterium melibiosiphilum]|uniref:Uncharacterized protein n=1 Tax=Cryobacterium melibiosiphilum TaxID=995039 RepID=A0A3A5MAN7_9MICO|nr:hypothetical protein [Cryobacterium melibiosiphilum]RJT85686.1 hypothetical protein D6T64_18940 [Cryobacterium melibiosiphilum]